MNRRKFLKVTGVGTTSTALASNAFGFTAPPASMTASDLNSYLRSLIDVDEPSVDRVVIGDPETPVQKIGTAWMPYWDTLKKAKDQGVNVMVVHEPTFYTHWDLDADQWDYIDAPDPARANYFAARGDKKKWIEDNKMVIIRCHDVLDKIPGWGIPYALGKALGFKNEDIIRSKTYYNVYKTAPTPAIDVARSIAQKLQKVGQHGVAFYGDKSFPVASIGLGTGCICDPLDYAELAPDLCIGIDDTIRTWIQTTYARDTGKPLIVINHGTSEEFGMRSLNEHLAATFQKYDVVHFDQGCSYELIT
jgi:putative NIF3 family GTP cyclohydrolase 1 type 2